MRLYRHHSSVTKQADGAKESTVARARVFSLGHGTTQPGWHMQRYVGGKLLTTPLDIHKGSKAIDAVVAAAACLNCPIAEIQVSGLEWPLYPDRD